MISKSATKKSAYYIEVYDRACRLLCPTASGVSVVKGNIIAWLPNDVSQNEQGAVQSFLDNLPMIVTSDKATIVANDTDTATITYSSNQTCKYLVYANEVLYAEGIVLPENGVISLELTSSISAQYRVFIIDGINSGFVNVTAN